MGIKDFTMIILGLRRTLQLHRGLLHIPVNYVDTIPAMKRLSHVFPWVRWCKRYTCSCSSAARISSRPSGYMALLWVTLTCALLVFSHVKRTR
jgi:hypothetical protein